MKNTITYLIGFLVMSLTVVTQASEWQSYKDIPNLRVSTSEDKAWLADIEKGMISYDFQDRDFLIHEGDLTIDSNFIATGNLVVKGNLTINGMYDDMEGLSRNFRTGYGFTIVLGDMNVENIYSWGSLDVNGDLYASGLILAIYNDFYFGVTGNVNAKGIIVQDKLAEFNRGEIGFAFLDQLYNEDRDSDLLENGFRQLLPKFISDPEFRDAIDPDYATLASQPVDSDGLRQHLMDGKPVLRETPAPPELPIWIATAISMETSKADLLDLIGKDPLVDQLIAARYDLPRKVKKALKKTEDPIVLKWLSYDM